MENDSIVEKICDDLKTDVGILRSSTLVKRQNLIFAMTAMPEGEELEKAKQLRTSIETYIKTLDSIYNQLSRIINHG